MAIETISKAKYFEKYNKRDPKITKAEPKKFDQ